MTSDRTFAAHANRIDVLAKAEAYLAYLSENLSLNIYTLNTSSKNAFTALCDRAAISSFSIVGFDAMRSSQ